MQKVNSACGSQIGCFSFADGLIGWRVASEIRMLEGLVEPGTYMVFTLAMLSNQWGESNLVDSASSHTLVSKIKPCMSKYNSFTLKTANGSLYQL